MFIWQPNSSGKTEKDKFTVNTEYVLLYSKSANYKLNEAYKPLSDGTRAMIVKTIMMVEEITVYTHYKSQEILDLKRHMIMLIIMVKYGLVLQKDGELNKAS